jgi:hypothetical protein
MRHTILEHPITHRFALVKVPARFVEGDKLPIPPDALWLATRADALAALAGLFDVDDEQREEDETS